jgi:aminopeptidase N
MDGIKSYFTKYAHGNATYDDLITEIAKQTKDPDYLKKWAFEWLESSGCTQISLGNSQLNFDGNGVTIKEIKLV